MKSILTTLALVAALSATATAADWPQHLGPTRDAFSTETGLARSWPEGGPKVLWSFDLGEGFGGPSVSEGKVYILDREESQRDVLRCIDLNSGREEWTFAYDAPGKTSFNGSRTAPTIDGDMIYSCGAFGDVYCVDIKTRKAVWNKNVMRDYGGEKAPMWAISQAPLLYKDTVIVASQMEQAGVVAYDKKTGDVVWKTPRLPGKLGYVTPVLMTIDGVDQVIMVSATNVPRSSKGKSKSRRRPAPKATPAEPIEKGGALGFDAATGKRLWFYDNWACKIPITQALDIGDGRVFITGGYDAGSAMIKVERKDGKFRVSELFKTQVCGSQTHPPLLLDGHLYMNSNSNSRADGMMCMDLDGKVKWKTERAPNFQRGGLIYADGMVYNLGGDTGVLHLIDPNTKAFTELAQADVLEAKAKKAWCPPALSDGKLLVRDQTIMKCLVVK